MNCEIQNLTRRLVSIHCNSGKTCHLPPGYTHELPEQEITGNAFVKKLQDRKLIAIRQPANTSAPKSSRADDLGSDQADTKSETEGDVKKTARKKSQSKK